MAPRFSPFSPYANLAGLQLADAPPIAWKGATHWEVLGCELWLTVRDGRFCVSDSDGHRLSEAYWNPAYAVERCRELKRRAEAALVPVYKVAH